MLYMKQQPVNCLNIYKAYEAKLLKTFFDTLVLLYLIAGYSQSQRILCYGNLSINIL
jgi:hypothetical protein